MEKRNRPPASCEPCRARKLKCDREQPCDTCVRRSKECYYSANARRGPRVPSKEAQLKEKLNKLENLVSSLVSQQPTSKDVSPASASVHSGNHLAPAGKSPDQLKESPRPVVAEDGIVSYVDASHWQSVLEELREVRETLSSGDVPSVSSDSPRTGGSTPLSTIPMFAENEPATIEELLEDLPTQPICNSILSNYFNAPGSVLAIVHPEKFRIQYEKFWSAPTEDPDYIWLALLFAILSLAITIRRSAKGADDSLPTPRTLQKRTTQCLVMGRYTTANANVLEALLLHMNSCFITDNSSYLQLWLALGHTIQLAQRLAYHREPSKLQNCSVLDAEMRRRVWMNLVQVDALGSFQIGLPSLIQNETYDTTLPGNYEFSDLVIGMTSLPPPRPLTQRTSTLYGICKAPVMAVFKKITQHVQALVPVTYEQTVALDQEMRNTYTNMPALMQARDVDKSFTDISALIWDRATVEILYLKGLVVLHRRYLRNETENPRYDFSRSSCVEAAMAILARQEDLYQASLPGGRLCEEKWILRGVTTTYDFILAAMVLCLDLSVRSKVSNGTESSPAKSLLDEVAKRELNALKTAHQIWTSEEVIFKEVTVAARTIEAMLKSIEDLDTANADPVLDENSIWTASAPAYDTYLTMSAAQAAPAQMYGMSAPAHMPVVTSDPMWDMIYSDNPPDWPLLDQYFHGGNRVSYEVGGEWDYVEGPIQ